MFVVRIFNFKKLFTYRCLPVCVCALKKALPLELELQMGCKPFRGCWVSILGPLQKQPML